MYNPPAVSEDAHERINAPKTGLEAVVRGLGARRGAVLGELQAVREDAAPNPELNEALLRLLDLLEAAARDTTTLRAAADPAERYIVAVRLSAIEGRVGLALTREPDGGARAVGLPADEAKRVAHALLLAADGIEPWSRLLSNQGR